jgi:hypothetical protein
MKWLDRILGFSLAGDVTPEKDPYVIIATAAMKDGQKLDCQEISNNA